MRSLNRSVFPWYGPSYLPGCPVGYLFLPDCLSSQSECYSSFIWISFLLCDVYSCLPHPCTVLHVHNGFPRHFGSDIPLLYTFHFPLTFFFSKVKTLLLVCPPTAESVSLRCARVVCVPRSLRDELRSVRGAVYSPPPNPPGLSPRLCESA